MRWSVGAARGFGCLTILRYTKDGARLDDGREGGVATVGGALALRRAYRRKHCEHVCVIELRIWQAFYLSEAWRL
jgi:hypothetical protein